MTRQDRTGREKAGASRAHTRAYKSKHNERFYIRLFITFNCNLMTMVAGFVYFLPQHRIMHEPLLSSRLEMSGIGNSGQKLSDEI